MIGWLVLAAAQAAAPMAGMAHGMGGEAKPACQAEAPPPVGLAGWSVRTALAAGADPAHAGVLTPGRGATVTLPATSAVSFAAAPGRTGAPDTHAGLLAFVVDRPGRYRVALGAGAWIDVVAGASPLTSVAHAPGPACTGIAKMVDFDLGAGRYLLQLSGAATPSQRLMVARLP